MQNKFVSKALVSAVFAACAATSSAAQAAVISFDGPEIDQLGSSIFAGGDSFSQQGFTLTAMDPFGSGLVGAIGMPDTCVVLECPPGTTSNYYLGLNDGALSISHGAGLDFFVNGFDISFVSAFPVVKNRSPNAALVLNGVTSGKPFAPVTLPFANAGADGKFRFGYVPAGGTLPLSELSFSTCLLDTNKSSCLPDSQLYGQFALDNLNVTAVPEPAPLALMALGLACIGAYRRRQAR